MREILIQNKDDFEKLKTLSGKEYIILKLGKNLSKIKISSISLANFSGTIDIFVEDKKKRYDFDILTDDKLKTYTFFKNHKKVIIMLPKNHKMHFNYKLINHDFHVYNGHQLKNALNISEDCNPINIYLHNDILYSQKTFATCNTVHIYGMGHIIYGKKESLKSLKSPNIQIHDTSLKEIDYYVYVSRLEELNKWKSHSNARIVFSLEKDFSNTTLNPVNLSNFYGSYILLGNGKKLNHIHLSETEANSIGLFSTISMTADFIVSDLIIEHLEYPMSSYEIVGTVLGSRQNNQISPYNIMSGKTLFRHCEVHNFCVPVGELYTGYMAGFVDKFAECIECDYTRVFSKNRTSYYGNMAYYDENTLTAAKFENSEYKRICFEPSRTLERKK